MIIDKVNTTGIRMTGAPNENLRQIRAYVESSSVQFWVELSDGTEVFQYLSPIDAMALSKALDRLAVEALRAGAE